ncbi:MAG TPA: type II secretion system minor pseudopilin GspJ [Steroidobacteraceae bacterium]|jgi:general secretion pathway protein J|nr:type II secretion system minor pseudopilin GspJ [Steroidobacteraceae bacterium]
MRARRRGFTLIELLVALFIAAVMFAIGYGAINQALQNRGTITRHQQNLVQLESAMQIMEQDFVQLAPRPVRDPGGNGEEACLRGSTPSDADTSDTSSVPSTSDTTDATDASDSDTATPLVWLTRAGWSNPIGEPRTELERVAYVLDNGTLVREHWAVLDATLSSLPVKRNLLKHVRSVSFQYMSINRSWVDTWPPASTGGENTADSIYRMRPLAVRVVLDTQQWGKISRIFETANDQ